MDCENYIHETIMYLISILENEETASMNLTKLTLELCKRGNTKPLKKVASGDSVEERVLTFLWQHPALFSTQDRIISIRPMTPDIDDDIEASLEERLIEFLVFRCNQYGPCQIPISKLMGNLNQAASDIRQHFQNNYSRFYNFLRARDDIFTLIDSETIALKSVHDQATNRNKPLLKCDEYYLDGRVLNCTRMVDTLEEGVLIIQEILNTKNLVAIDCEGVNLGAFHGYITLVQIAVVDDLPDNYTDEDVASAIKIYLFDVQANEDLMYTVLKRLLRAEKVTKIFQGCSSDTTALYNRYKILTRSVFDTVIAHRHLYEGVKSDLYYLYEFYVGETTNRMKKDIKKKYICNPKLWTTRPLNELLTYYAAFDVFALIRIYYKLKAKIDEKTYNEIFSASSAAAQSAYKRSLPYHGLYLYAQGYTERQVHAEIGWEIDSDDEMPIDIYKERKRGSTIRPNSHNKQNNPVNRDNFRGAGSHNVRNEQGDYNSSVDYHNDPFRGFYNQSGSNFQPKSNIKYTRSDRSDRSQRPMLNQQQQFQSSNAYGVNQRHQYQASYQQPYQYQNHYQYQHQQQYLLSQKPQQLNYQQQIYQPRQSTFHFYQQTQQSHQSQTNQHQPNNLQTHHRHRPQYPQQNHHQHQHQHHQQQQNHQHQQQQNHQQQQQQQHYHHQKLSRQENDWKSSRGNYQRRNGDWQQSGSHSNSNSVRQRSDLRSNNQPFNRQSSTNSDDNPDVNRSHNHQHHTKAGSSKPFTRNSNNRYNETKSNIPKAVE